jgi:murein L,D-transpeptidase YafK
VTKCLAAALAAVILAVLVGVPAQAANPPLVQQQASLTPGGELLPDRVVVLKSERRMVLMYGSAVIRVYNVALGRYPKGHKMREGDSRTPEGSYTLDYRLEESLFHRAIRISYPNERDRARAREAGVDPGGQIMIHGLPNDWTAEQIDHPRLDWTQGCIAVTNEEMDEIWRLVRIGTPIDIYP